MKIPMAMAVSRSLFLLIIVVGFIGSSSSSQPSPASHSSHVGVATKPRKLEINLIHRDSVSSPFYNPNASPFDLARKAVEASLARSQYYNWRIKSRIDRDGSYSTNVDAGGVSLYPDNLGSTFLANIMVGEPASEQVVMVDTASSLTWIHCAPCPTCPKQSPIMFEPLKSSSYAGISCSSGNTTCADGGGKCDPTGGCLFNIKYPDGSEVSGNLASEKITFGSENYGKIALDMKFFGCAHESSRAMAAGNQLSGRLGIGYGDESLVKQWGKFSICLGDISDPGYQYNKLVFGEEVDFEGNVTPIDVLRGRDGFYYVSLEGISVGDEKLNIDPNVFKLRPFGQGGTILDTGSTMNLITSAGYGPLRSKVQTILDATLQRAFFSIGGVTLLCYKGKVDPDIAAFPEVTFHLAGGVDIVLDKDSMFWQANEGTLCMAVAPVEDEGGVSVIGAYALQSYNVGFDVPAGKAYISRIDCQQLQN